MSACLKAPYRWREVLGAALCALGHHGTRRIDLSRAVPHPNSSESPMALKPHC